MKKAVLNVLWLLMLSGLCYSQSIKQLNRLVGIKNELKTKFNQLNEERNIKAKRLGLPINIDFENGNSRHLHYFEGGDKPIYLTTTAAISSASISANKLYPSAGLGYSLTGNGVTIGQWDSYFPLTNHVEFTGRIVLGEPTNSISSHPTQVAGVMISSGVDPNVKGIAYQANILYYNYKSQSGSDNFLVEIANEAAAGMLLSNHSYTVAAGWDTNTIEWHGDSNISEYEDYKFGYYDFLSKTFDEISNNAPYFNIVFGTGNDNGNGRDYEYISSPPLSPLPEMDGGDDHFDCIPPLPLAKNVIAVGNIADIPNGYTQSSDVTFGGAGIFILSLR